MKKMLILKASEDIHQAEIDNISSQIKLYGIDPTVCTVQSTACLHSAFYSGNKYDYFYLAAHGCDTSFGNSSGEFNIPWLTFAAMICQSQVANDDAIFLHSCCRGGLDQVAYRMFGCCSTIELICGPRYNVSTLDLVTAFNLFLYNIQVKKIDPVRAAEKVLDATDIRLVCYDKLETTMHQNFINHCQTIGEDILKAFAEVDKIELAQSAKAIAVSPHPKV